MEWIFSGVCGRISAKPRVETRSRTGIHSYCRCLLRPQRQLVCETMWVREQCDGEKMFLRYAYFLDARAVPLTDFRAGAGAADFLEGLGLMLSAMDTTKNKRNTYCDAVLSSGSSLASVVCLKRR